MSSFEITKKLKREQKMQGKTKKAKAKGDSSDEEGQVSDDDDDGDFDDITQMFDMKERSTDRRNKMDANKGLNSIGSLQTFQWRF